MEVGRTRWICVGICALAASLQAATVERVFRPERHSRGDTNVRMQQPIDEASWIWAKGSDVWGGAVFSETRTEPETLAKMPQSFFRFRKDFTVTDERLELDVSADERFVLLLDGEPIARGPMRGLPNRWHYESYRVSGLTPGEHRLEAVCWQVGEHAPLAQVSIRGGFIVKASGGYDAQLTTGKATWKVAPLGGTRMTHKGKSGAFGVGSQCEVRGTGLLNEVPSADAWMDAVVVRGPVKTWAGLVVQGWRLFPSPLKDLMYELKTPGAVKRGFDALKPGAVVSANTKVTAWWDLGNYYCAYPLLTVSGGKGATVRWDWAECLTGVDGKKGDRAAFEGLDMPRPFGDVFRCDGRSGARFSTPWWRCGRWCRLTVETADEPLTLDKVEIAETRYPVEMAASFDCDDPFVMKMQPVCARALQMCMHEMFFDCPYYEQQMYPGDSRLQYLVSGFFDTEDRIVRNAINLYDADRRENGQIPMNCPTRGTQDALGFTCCEAMMFGDYAWNHTNREWLKAKMPGLNHTLMGMDEFTNADGLLGKTPGWNFIDWVSSWKGGVPPDGDAESPNAEMNLQYLHAMLSTVIAEEAVGDMPLAAYWRARAERLKAAIKATFWCGDKALFASNVGKTAFSEHSQCLALLADVVTGEEAARCFKALVETPNLARGTIYYKHYLFLTYFKFHRADLFFGNLGFWRNCLEWNLSTILETPGINSRSDCHGWGSHPLWHLHTGVAGVKSAAPFYEKVLVEPQPAHLKRIRSATPTPKGDVKLDLSFGDGNVKGTVTLPEGLTGVFRWKGRDTHLSAGPNAVVSATNCCGCSRAGRPACSDPYDYKELVAREVNPVKVAPNAAGHVVADFGKDAVGWLELEGPDAGPYEIVIGELLNGKGEVTNEYPTTCIRCQRLVGQKPPGKYRVPMPADRFNLKGYDPKAPAIRLPDRFGIVFPFRYVEIVRGPKASLRQVAVNYPIDMGKSVFRCDCADLERVYEMCKYSILATSFCGVYVDGDRERTPYEADAYINQLCHYAIDDDYSLARKSHEWLMEHPTWPTEWRQHSIMMAWADWMWTGDTRSVAKYYEQLAGEKLMLKFARPSDGLLETGGERKKGAKPGASDIVDWPEAERDGFVFRPVNAVVNAFFYRNLREMSDLSKALGKADRAAAFSDRAQQVQKAFEKAFYRPEVGLYADGEGTDHCSLHANVAALAFGLVPKDRVAAIADFIERKGMACSVYFSQYLLEALFKADRAEAAIRLMTSHGDRSWIGMMDFGSTVSMEAWNVAAKPNLDLNHAWGSTPLNVIARYVIGVTPLEPGFRKIAIRPQMGGLKRLSATVPTVAGPVTVKIEDGVLEFTSPSPSEVTFAGKTYNLPAGCHKCE